MSGYCPPWTLRCPEPGCEWSVIVNARGARGNDPGAGVEAALLLRDHKTIFHSDRAQAVAPKDSPAGVLVDGEQTA